MDDDFFKQAKSYIAIAAGIAIGVICVYNVVNLIFAGKGPGTIVVQIHDTDKEPVAGAAIHIQEENGARVTYSNADTDGVYEQDNFEPGKYSIRVSKAGFETSTVLFKIKAGRTKKLKIKLQPSPSSPLEEFGIKPISTK
jgi:uncharacterized membrane protein